MKIIKGLRRVAKGVHGGLMVTKEQFDSYRECAKSLEVEERGPKECDGRKKTNRWYKWRFGLRL